MLLGYWMNQKLLSLFILILLISGWKGFKSNLSHLIEIKEFQLSATDSLSLSIEAIHLSEDMSRLSTKNDELLILIYESKDSLGLDKFLFSKQFKLDEKTRSRKIWFSTKNSLTKNKLLFFLIEQDSDTPIEQIDLILRVHYKEIIDAFESKDYLEIGKFIGDEDVLGVKTISSLPSQFEFSGIHKLDKYEYLVRIGE